DLTDRGGGASDQTIEGTTTVTRQTNRVAASHSGHGRPCCQTRSPHPSMAPGRIADHTDDRQHWLVCRCPPDESRTTPQPTSTTTPNCTGRSWAGSRCAGAAGTATSSATSTTTKKTTTPTRRRSHYAGSATSAPPPTGPSPSTTPPPT